MQFVQFSVTLLNSDFTSLYHKTNIKSDALPSRQKHHLQLRWMVDQAQPRGFISVTLLPPVDTEEQGHA